MKQSYRQRNGADRTRFAKKSLNSKRRRRIERAAARLESQLNRKNKMSAVNIPTAEQEVYIKSQLEILKKKLANG